MSADAGTSTTKGKKYRATLEALPFDLRSGILLPENNLSPHKSDL